MKAFLILSLLFAITSCGKNDSSSSGPEEEAQNGYVDINNTGSHPDLMNVTLDVPVRIGSDRIQILRGASLTDQGSRSLCSFQVRADEEWFYTLSGNQLRVDLADGSQMILKRLSGVNVNGIWSWSGPHNGMKVIRRLSLLDDRLILNQDCEG